MNWTGGRLQRHSKPNANAQVKAQQDYFARARLRQNSRASVPSRPKFSIAAASEPQQQSRHTIHRPEQYPALDEDQAQQGRRRLKAEHLASKTHAIDPLSVSHRRAKVQSSHGTTPPRVNTLEHVKRSLLKQPDWLGLAGTRPPKPDPRLGPISEHVGRRRRVTREDRHRQKHGGGQRKIQHSFIQPFAKVDGASALRLTPSANLSIRLGSNIHQSQHIRSERQSDNPASVIPHSSSTEPMLFDMVEARHYQVMPKPGEYYLAETNDADGPTTMPNRRDIPNEGGLVPLEEVREFASFDEVKRYSSSARHVSSSSSRSASGKILGESSRSRIPSVLHTSSSRVHGKPVDDPGLFSSNENKHRLVSIGSEPPPVPNRREDISMQETGADIVMADVRSTSQEAQEPRSCDTPKVASHESLSASQNFSYDDSSLATPASDPAIEYTSRDAHHINTASRRRPRFPYTIERQVLLEELCKQRSNRDDLPVKDRSTVPIDFHVQGDRRQRKHERVPASERRGPAARFCKPEAKTCLDQTEHFQNSHAQSSSFDNGHQRQGDENEAWMRDFCSTDFEKLRERFSFAKAPARRKNYQTPPRNMALGERTAQINDRPDILEWRKTSSQYSPESSLPETIRTNVNTVLNAPSLLEHDGQRNVFMPSETEFLTRMSPTTGYLDERIANLSTYNNAANTVREFANQTHMAAKRTASDAFGDNSYDQYDTSSQPESKVAQTSSPAPHRVPLHTLYQAPVRSHPVEEFHASQNDLKHVSRSVWRHTGASSMANNNMNDRSGEQRDLPSRTKYQHLRFPLDYTPVRMSAGQLGNGMQSESSRQALNATTSHFDSQVFSPTQSSGYRVPLTSGHAPQNTDISHYEHQALTHPATARNHTPSARLGTATSPCSAGLAPTSSSSDIPLRNTTGQVVNFHTNQMPNVFFKKPQRPTAQYGYPSRLSPRFRAPSSVPLPLH